MSEPATTPQEYDRTRSRRENLRDQFRETGDLSEKLQFLRQEIDLIDDLACKLLEEIFIISTAVARQSYRMLQQDLLISGLGEVLIEKEVMSKDELLTKVKELAKGLDNVNVSNDDGATNSP